ncbi:MAG TPA: Stp1/IreP family PP2C-type Ser/Thr phosphatase [Gaiellaceae bacterium]
MSVFASSARTDTGRKRRRNEDALVCEPPLFAIADGMGGAKAGEVASRLAAETLREQELGDLSAPEQTVELIREANRRVFAYSSENASARGMGTTMTVALVEENKVTIGHVGDSRAYLLRDEQLTQLTQDHSLVAELVRSGRLSAEEAESHPRRSVITRALGTDSEVEVDVFSLQGQDRDIYLLCSDGLTSMVSDDEIASLLSASRDDLDEATRKLVAAANQAGGEDNISVVLFSLEGVEPEPGQEQAAESENAKTLTEIDAVPALKLEPKHDSHDHQSRRLILLALACAFLVALIGLGVFTVSAAHFIGADSDGRVAVYQGLPYELPGGIHLYRPVRVSSHLYAAQLTVSERKQLFDHELHSYDDSTRELRKMEGIVNP